MKKRRVRTFNTSAYAEPNAQQLLRSVVVSDGAIELLETRPRRIIAVRNVQLGDKFILLLLVRHFAQSLALEVPKVEILAARADGPRHLVPVVRERRRRFMLGKDANLGDEGNVQASRPSVVDVLGGPVRRGAR